MAVVTLTAPPDLRDAAAPGWEPEAVEADESWLAGRDQFSDALVDDVAADAWTALVLRSAYQRERVAARTKVLGARAGRVSNDETARAAAELLERMKRDRLALTHVTDKALADLAAGVPARTVAVELADALDRFTSASRAERRCAA